MKPILILIILATTLLNCKNNNDIWEISNILIDENVIINHQKEFNYTNRVKLLKYENEYHLLNLGKNNYFVNLNLTTGQFKRTKLNISNEILAVNYEANTLSVLTSDSLLIFDSKGNRESYKSPLKKHQFVIHPMYCETLHKYNDLFYIQLGNVNNSLNYTDDSLLLFFNKDTTFRKFDYPSNYHTNYQHYSEVCLGNGKSGDFFYIPTLLNRISKRNLNKYIAINSDISKKGFLKFDTTKMKDVLYIHNFTKNTKYNLRLLVNDDYIFLVQRDNIDKNNNYNLNCIVYDYSLKKISEIVIKDDVDLNMIGIDHENILFLNPVQSKILSWSIK